MIDEPRLIIFSGAGLDAGSDIPTFRDTNGLWAGHDISEVCNIATWQRNYAKVHEFYNERRIELGGAKPNAAHNKIAEWQKRYGVGRVINITANVTDLLERAGVQNVMHIHGTLKDIIKDYQYAESSVVDIGYTAYDYRQDVLEDGSYKARVKPAVVFFGETAPRYEDMSHVLFGLRPKDIVILVGSTLEVNPVHRYLMGVGCKIVNVNPGIDEAIQNASEGRYTPLAEAADIGDINISESAISGFEKLEDVITDMMDCSSTALGL
ncbi:NAD-dependent deacetylase [Vibrio breoganii]